MPHAPLPDAVEVVGDGVRNVIPEEAAAAVGRAEAAAATVAAAAAAVVVRGVGAREAGRMGEEEAEAVPFAVVGGGTCFAADGVDVCAAVCGGWQELQETGRKERGVGG